MCIGLPGKVVLIKGGNAKIKQRGHFHWVEISPLKGKIKKGDFVITYQNVAINKISKKEARKILKLMDSAGDTGIKSPD